MASAICTALPWLSMCIYDARSFVEQVVMDCGLLDSEFLQLHHYWFNFLFREGDIAHGHGVVGRALEGRPGSNRQGRHDKRPPDRNF